MAASESDMPLDVRWAEDLRLRDGAGKVAHIASNGANGELLHLVAARVPVARGEGIWHILGEDAHRLHAVRGDGGIVNRLKVLLGPELLRQLATLRCRETVAPRLFGE